MAYNPNLMPWDRPDVVPMPWAFNPQPAPVWQGGLATQPPLPPQPERRGMGVPQQAQRAGFTPSPLPPMPPMPGAMPSRPAPSFAPPPQPRDRRIRTGSPLQTAFWALAALAAPEAAASYMQGREQGFQQADETDYRAYQIDRQRAEQEAQWQAGQDADAQRDAWLRYNAGMDQRQQVQRENEQGQDAAYRQMAAEGRTEIAAERAAGAEYKTRLNSGLDYFKSRGLAPSPEFHAWARDPDRYPYPELTAAPAVGSPMAARASQTDFRDNVQAPNVRSQTAYRDNVQTPLTQARTADIGTDNRRQDAALALRTTQVLNNLAIASQRLAQQGARASGGGSRSGGGARSSGGGRSSGGRPAAPKAPKAPRKPTETERTRQQARRSRLDPGQYKYLTDLGFAPGEQMQESYRFWKGPGGGGVMATGADGKFSVNYDHPRYPEFMQDQEALRGLYDAGVKWDDAKDVATLAARGKTWEQVRDGTFIKGLPKAKQVALYSWWKLKAR